MKPLHLFSPVQGGAPTRSIPEFAALFIAVGAVACSGAGARPPPSFTADALLSLQSDSSALAIQVRTSPQPPQRGTVDVELTVNQTADGSPVDGLTLAVTPWMPAHDHGTSLVPTVSAQGNGVYLVSDVDFFMAGYWELRTTFSGPITDHAAPAFEIP
jgi:hypothetical protein